MFILKFKIYTILIFKNTSFFWAILFICFKVISVQSNELAFYYDMDEISFQANHAKMRSALVEKKLNSFKQQNNKLSINNEVGKENEYGSKLRGLLLIPITLNYNEILAITLNYLSFLIIIILFLLIYSILVIKESKQLKKKIKGENKAHLHKIKTKFSMPFSHVLRTPLTLILESIKNLLNAKRVHTKQQEFTQIIDKKSNKSLNLITDLKLHDNKKFYGELDICEVEITEFINNKYLDFMEEARKKKLNYTFNHNLNLIKIEADADKLNKIIFSLISNAFKLTPEEGDISITINFAIKTENEYSIQQQFGALTTDEFIEISVSNSGVGIDIEKMSKLFDNFSFINTTIEEEANIGLSISKKFTLLHQGEIISRSTLNIGSQFIIRIPQNQTAQQEVLFGKSKKLRKLSRYIIKQPERLIPDLNENYRILIVDDNNDMRNYVETILHPTYKTNQAKSANDGLSILKNQNIDLIISDVIMPEIDGFEFCKIVKSNVEYSHIPFIMLTGLSSINNKITGFEEGADAYITKPFDKYLLLTQVNTIIKQRQKLRESFQQYGVSNKSINTGKLNNFFIKKLDQLIEKHMHQEDFSVEFLSSKMGISRSQLHRKLKQLTSFTATTYINKIRLSKATELIVENNYLIDEISFMVGFSSPSYFCKCFKQAYGISPLVWKKQNKKS